VDGELAVVDAVPLLNGVVEGADEAMQRNAAFLKQFVRETTGITLAGMGKKGTTITLKLSNKVANAEGYVITVKPRAIVIEGKTPQGVFYGIQTLRKSLPVEQTATVNLPVGKIVDYPRFGYRGSMLDCARHYFSVPFIKEYIDVLALHNINTFHWHLTEDQGWRVEIKRYPKLTEIGSKRAQTVMGNNTELYDGVPYGGYYTQDEMRDIVKYAAERYITIIPEIDMPGHSQAFVRAMGHDMQTEQGMQELQTILEEVAKVFVRAPYIHFGADEHTITYPNFLNTIIDKIHSLGNRLNPFQT